MSNILRKTRRHINREGRVLTQQVFIFRQLWDAFVAECKLIAKEQAEAGGELDASPEQLIHTLLSSWLQGRHDARAGTVKASPKDNLVKVVPGALLSKIEAEGGKKGGSET